MKIFIKTEGAEAELIINGENVELKQDNRVLISGQKIYVKYAVMEYAEKQMLSLRRLLDFKVE